MWALSIEDQNILLVIRIFLIANGLALSYSDDSEVMKAEIGDKIKNNHFVEGDRGILKGAVWFHLLARSPS